MLFEVTRYTASGLLPAAMEHKELRITGEMLLGTQTRSGSGSRIHADNPDTGEQLEPAFAGAAEPGMEEVALACRLAESAFDSYRETTLSERAGFLEAIADELLALGDTLIDRAIAESGLPRMRIEGERGRTVSQMRLFAQVVRDGDWLGARLDTPLPERKPLARADLRMRNIALGPVAVFGASNFPLAFSVAGGDTASALAAGCPVVAKSHPSHLGTSELAGRAIQAAIARCRLPEGVFSLVHGEGNAVGHALVRHPLIQAVGFTGSRRGGLALARLAADRPQPIPVYAEMSSVNPLFLLPGALAARAESMGTAFVDSVTLGVGQFCTNPGLVFGVGGADFDRFAAAAAQALSVKLAGTMLSIGIAECYAAGRAAMAGLSTVLAEGQILKDQLQNGSRVGKATGQPALFRTTGEHFLDTPALSGELFGPSSLLVACSSFAELTQIARQLEGQLTCGLFLETSDLGAEDYKQALALLPILERKAGRILVNSYPTGVEVCHAMVHGGPYPSTTDSRTTSVGPRAIERFLRPICYQDLPAALLPASLRDENPLGIRRLLDSVFSQDTLR